MRKQVYSETGKWITFGIKKQILTLTFNVKSPLKGVHHPKESFSLLLPVFIYNHWAIVAVAHIRVSYLINTIKFPSKMGIIMIIIIMLWLDWFQSLSNLYSLFGPHNQHPIQKMLNEKHYWIGHIPKSDKTTLSWFLFPPDYLQPKNIFFRSIDHWIRFFLI